MELIKITVLEDLAYTTKTDKIVVYAKNRKKDIFLKRQDINAVTPLYKGKYIYKTRCIISCIIGGESLNLVVNTPLKEMTKLINRTVVRGFLGK